MATLVLNPVNFTIIDAKAGSDGVTSAHVLVGTATGGPYTTATYALTSAEVATLVSSGTVTGTLASVGETLPAGTYFGVSQTTNGSGTSGNSPEASFQIQAAPSPPTGFSVS